MINKVCVSIFLFTALLYSCSEKEEFKKEKVSFTIGVPASGISGGRVVSSELPAGTSLLISLSDNTGNPVLTRHRINLLHLGNSYITDPLELPPGRYSLTDFLLVSDSSEVLFATPLKNSKLSRIVIHPLPYSFVVSKNNVANVEMEVVDANINQPQDFGYAAFNVNVVNPLRISVFKKEGNRLLLTDAKVCIYYNGDTLYNYDLKATINLLSFKGDVSSSYTLIISKEGYEDFTRTFTYDSLIAELGDKPLKAILEASPVVPTLTYWGSSNNTIVGYNASGVLEVDYGNGDTETRQLNYRPEAEGQTDGNWLLLISYSPQTSNPVKVTGDLDFITSFYQNDGGRVDLSALKFLKDLTLENSYLDTLDLTNNTELTSLNLYQVYPNRLILPAAHNIKYFKLVGDAAYRDLTITNIYNNAVAKNITDGFLDISESYEPFPQNVQDEIATLVNTYGWTINFDL